MDEVRVPREPLRGLLAMLESSERINSSDIADWRSDVGIAIDELRKHLAAAPQPEPARAEPVAYMVSRPVDVGVGTAREVVLSWEPGLPDEPSEPLYTHPQIDAAEVLRLADEIASKEFARGVAQGVNDQPLYRQCKAEAAMKRADLCRALGVP